MLGMQYGIAGKEMAFQGYADDYDQKIAAIEFSLDKGKTWTSYSTVGATSDRLVHWTFAYTPDRSGRYRLMVRAVNERGEKSPLSDCVDFLVEDSKLS